MRTLELFVDSRDLSFGSTGVSNRTPRGLGFGGAGNLTDGDVLEVMVMTAEIGFDSIFSQHGF